jgi:hypothetical protein
MHWLQIGWYHEGMAVNLFSILPRPLRPLIGLQIQDFGFSAFEHLNQS